MDGFLLSDVSYLLEDVNKLNDQSATVNQGNAEIVKKLLDNTTDQWMEFNKDSDREGPFALLEVNNLRTDKSIGYYSNNAAIVNTELANLAPGFSSEDLKKILDSTITKVSKFTLHWRVNFNSSFFVCSTAIQLMMLFISNRLEARISVLPPSLVQTVLLYLLWLLLPLEVTMFIIMVMNLAALTLVPASRI